MAKTEILGIGSLKADFGKARGDAPRLARRVVVAGGRVLKDEAKSIARANGSVRTGAMVENIAIKRESKAGPGIEQYNLGVRHGRDQSRKVRKAGNRKLSVNADGRIKSTRDNDPFYWRWVELGHKTVSRRSNTKRGKQSIRKRRAQSSGWVNAKPFIGPALERKKTDVIAAMGQAAAKEVEKLGRK
ncbi:HK97 gp10 family phage protein [Comamonas odontotermitis]|uniref:HK97 gp10 family phage protein n=1 Tax=Comamonas odontotermitis TaxID=379895 RepID=UPI0037509118